MELLELVGYFTAILIGFSLGLIGGGGSVLTVPVLVYLFQTEAVLATAYSLFVVGIASAIGATTYMRAHLVSYRTAIVFGIPSVIAVYLTRKFIMPALPDPLFQWGTWVLDKNAGVMLLFAGLMIFAAVSMIRGGAEKTPIPTGDKSAHTTGPAVTEPDLQQLNYPLIMVEGIVVGMLTGLVGAGGGFMIVPALVVLARIPMRLAIGTSLLIIAAKSLLGFLGDIGNQPIEWSFLFIFTMLAIFGIYFGTWLSKRISAATLRTTFGYFVVLMGVWVLYQELLR